MHGQLEQNINLQQHIESIAPVSFQAQQSFSMANPRSDSFDVECSDCMQEFILPEDQAPHSLALALVCGLELTSSQVSTLLDTIPPQVDGLRVLLPHGDCAQDAFQYRQFTVLKDRHIPSRITPDPFSVSHNGTVNKSTATCAAKQPALALTSSPRSPKGVVSSHFDSSLFHRLKKPRVMLRSNVGDREGLVWQLICPITDCCGVLIVSATPEDPATPAQAQAWGVEFADVLGRRLSHAAKERIEAEIDRNVDFCRQMHAAAHCSSMTKASSYLPTLHESVFEDSVGDVTMLQRAGTSDSDSAVWSAHEFWNE